MSLNNQPLKTTTLGGTSLGNTTLGGTSLGNTTLGGTSLGNTTLGGTSLGNTTLGGTSLGNTTLGGTSLGKTQLGGTSLGGIPLKPQQVVINKQPINNNSKPKPVQPQQKPKPQKGTTTTPTQKESSMGAKIRQMQEEKRKKEEEEERRVLEEKEKRRLELLEEERINKERNEKIKLQKQLQLEKLKEDSIQKTKDLKIQNASSKYGYIPTVLTKDKPIKKYIPKKIIKEVVVIKEENIIIEPVKDNNKDDTRDDWDALSNSSEEQTTSVQQQEQPQVELIKEENKDDELRAPIVCVLGHVDAGKTHLLDKIRSSVVHMGEAGNITQQIGASYVPITTIIKHTKHMDNQFKKKLEYKVNGLIFIDTPGHEPFMNMRSRGSSLCDIAILVVDILVGIQKQTLECIKLLIESKKLFVIALNKVDLLYGWKVTKDGSIKNGLNIQDKNVIMEYEDRVRHIWTQFQELGHNTELYYKNKDFVNTISMVPISAITGEGLPDLLMLLAQLSQKYIGDNLIKNDTIDCTVLEVKNVQGRGMTIDVILTNGSLTKGDTIMVCGIKGEPIITYIKALLTHTYSNRKGEYINTNKVHASMTCKIDAPNLDDAVAGSQLFVIKNTDTEDTIENYRINVMKSLNSLKSKINNMEQGVYVNASTLGGMEALFEYLCSDSCKVSIGGFRIGSVHKKDITKAAAVSEKNYSCILAFDVNIDDDVRKYAENLGVKIFEEKIIYKLFDMFSEYINKIRKDEDDKMSVKAIFPCVCEILPECIYNKKSPIIIGIRVKKGILKKGTPISVFSNDEERKEIEIGIIASIERNHKQIDEASMGDDVCVSIIQKDTEQQYSYGRHFDDKNKLYSKISRESIDALKTLHPDIVVKKDIFNLLMKLKGRYGII
jgi:translation initiation factor 5B